MEDLTPKKTTIIDDKSNIVIKKVYKTLEGGRALDLTQWYSDHGQDAPVPAGWLIVATKSKTFVPCPLSGINFAVPQDGKAVGVLMDTITAPRQAAAIMTAGVVNPKACVHKWTATDKDLVKTAGLLITFETDEDEFPNSPA